MDKSLSLLDDEWWEKRSPWALANKEPVQRQASSDDIMAMGEDEQLTEEGKENLTLLDDEWWEKRAPWVAFARQTAKKVAKASAVVKAPAGAPLSPAASNSKNIPSLPTDLVLNVLETHGLSLLRPAARLSSEWCRTTKSYSERWKGLLQPLEQRFGNGLLASPDTVALLPDGTLAVSDFGASCVEIFRLADGAHLRTIGQRGERPWGEGPELPLGRFECVKGLASDDEHLYVADYFGNRVQRMRLSSGAFAACASVPTDDPDVFAAAFCCPHGLALARAADGSKLLLVSEAGSEPGKETSESDLLDWQGNAALPSEWGRISLVDARSMRWKRTLVKAAAHKGGDPRLMSPLGIAAHHDELYVCDRGNSCVHVYSISKACADAKPPVDPYVRRIGGPGDKPGQFRQPVGVAVTAGDLLVVTGEWRVQVLTLQGAPLRMLPFGRLVSGVCVGRDRVYLGLPQTQFHNEEPKLPEVGVVKMAGRWIA